MARPSKVEAGLRGSEWRLRALFDGAPIGAMFTALEGQLESVNPALCRIAGYAEDELVGRHVSDVVHPDDRAANSAAFRALIAGEIATHQSQQRWLRKDGEEVSVSLIAFLIRDERGQPLGFAAQIQDIGERVRAEQELRLSETRLRAIMESAHDSIIVTDRQAIIRYSNPAAEALFGYGPGELIGLDSNRLLAEESRAAHQRERARFQETGHPPVRLGHLAELTAERKDGSRTPCELSLTSWTIDGEMFFAAFARGISERKRIEAELINAKLAAEEATSAKSAFLARMSHEIRTPMNGVSGMIELALRTALTPAQRDYLETARSSAVGLLGVINDVLDFSKIEAGKLDLANDPFSLQECLEGAVRALAPLSNAKGLELLLSLPRDVPDRLIGDRWRLRQIITNLLSNAIKFTDRGEIVVDVRMLDWIESDVTIEVRVIDTGIGIAASEHEAIFETFRQAEETSPRRFGGTGLGLAICTQLVKLMNGTIGVRSVPGHGSTFHFSARFGLGEDAWCDLPASELRGIPVMVGIPHRGLRTLVCNMLTSWTMRPLTFENAGQALTILSERSATGRVVLLDEGFPGVQALEEDLLAVTGADARIIRFTRGASGSGIDSGDRRCVWLSKPITSTVLLETIEAIRAVSDALWSGRRAASEAPPTLPPLRVLLAEDNPVNQRVATILLESAGHSVVSVSNGGQALIAFSSQPFDVLLMDLQMPEMDGLEVMRRIRAQERPGQHARIVALTAQALRGDREMCLAAGADTYLAKPFNAQELFRAIEETLGIDPRHRGQAATGSSPHGISVTPSVDEMVPIFEAETLLETLRGDRAAAREIVAAFFETLPGLRTDLDASLSESHPGAIKSAAHKMKGMLLALGARRAGAQAARLESAASAGLLEGARVEGQALGVELVRLVAELSQWIEGPDASAARI